jgi:hypothetical protein
MSKRFGQSWRKFKVVTTSGKANNPKVIPGFANDRTCLQIRGNPCASKLVFLRPDAARKAGTKPGPNLVYCVGEGKPGAYIPVSSAREATELGKKFCACTKSGGSAKRCSAPAAFAGMRRKKRRGSFAGAGDYEAGGKTFPMFMQAVRYASERRLEVFEVQDDGSRIRRWAPGTVKKPGKRHILVGKDGSRTEFTKVRR